MPEFAAPSATVDRSTAAARVEAPDAAARVSPPALARRQAEVFGAAPDAPAEPAPSPPEPLKVSPMDGEKQSVPTPRPEAEVAPKATAAMSAPEMPSVESSEALAEPSEASAEPSEASAEPSEASAEPSEATASEAPRAEGEASGGGAAPAMPSVEAPPARAAAGEAPAADAAPAPGAESAEAAPARRGGGARGGRGGGRGGRRGGRRRRGGPSRELIMPPAPTAPGPEAQARQAEVRARMAEAAEIQAELPGGAATVAATRAAVQVPDAEAAGRAAGEATAELARAAPPSPEIAALCEPVFGDLPLIYFTLRAERPEDEEELLDTDPQAIAADAGATLDGDIRAQQGVVEQGYADIETTPTGETPPAPAALETPPASLPNPPMDAAGAAPDPIPEEDLDLSADLEAQQAAMRDAGMETEPARLVQEGPIAEAREAEQALGETAAEAPAVVRARQQQTLADARAAMAALQAQAETSLGAQRQAAASGTAAQQRGGVQTEEQMRADAGRQMRDIFQGARDQVRDRLATLPQVGMQRWEAEVAILSSAFRADLDYIKRRIERRHESTAAAIWDWATGLPRWVTAGYDAAERTFVRGVCRVLLEISSEVNTVIADCERIIADARRDIAAVVDALPASLQDWAAGEAAGFDQQLDGLAAEVVQTQQDFDRQLIDASVDAVQTVREEVEALRAAARGLIGRIADAIEAFLDDPIRAIVNGLLSLVGISPASFWALVDRIGQVAEQIADDPETFVNNLMDALGQGFRQFFDNFGTHLLNAFVQWLFSSMGSVGVEIPQDFSLRSVITFFLQLMGITWDRIRRLLARHIGEDNVALIERAYELISTLIEQGPEGIFEMIKEQLDPQMLLDMVIEAAVDYMVQTIVSRVAARLLMLFNPVGAILQAIEAIYRVARWIFENAARIFTLVETVVNGIAAILAGDIGGMANAIEQALAGLMVPVIDFIAGYLGLGGLPDRIAEVVRGFQARVEALLDRVIGWLAGRARALLARLGIGGADEEEGPAEVDEAGRIRERTTMSGEPHVVTVDPERGEVLMASDREQPLDQKIAIATQHLEDLKASDPARGRAAEARLGTIRARSEQIRELLTQFAERSAAGAGNREITRRRDDLLRQIKGLTEQIVGLLKTYGDEFEVHSLLEPILGFPPAVLGVHPMSTEKRAVPPPDGIPRESHHVPPNEFAHSTLADLAATAASLGDLNPPLAVPPKIAERLTLDIPGTGDGLPAILLHQTTHRTGANAVHRTRLRSQFEARTRAMHDAMIARREGVISETEDEIRRAAADLRIQTGTGRLAVNPRSTNWSTFIHAARAAARQIEARAIAEARAPREAPPPVSTATSEGSAPTAATSSAAGASEQVVARVDRLDEAIERKAAAAAQQDASEEIEVRTGLEIEVDTGIEVAYRAAMAQAVGSMVASLEVSVVDGPKAEHPTGAQMRDAADANPLWRKLREGT